MDEKKSIHVENNQLWRENEKLKAKISALERELAKKQLELNIEKNQRIKELNKTIKK